MALNPNALTSVAQVRAVAPGLGGTTDAVLELLINAASQAFEDLCDRVFRDVIVKDTPSGNDEAALEYYQGHNRHKLRLCRWPIISVQRVRIDGAEFTDYKLYPGLKEEGYLWRDQLWPARVARYPDLTGDPDPEAGQWNIDVAYTAGYATIPADLELACIQEVVSAVTRPSAGLESERTPGGWSQKWSVNSAQFSSQTLDVLSRYSRSAL